uniref:Reverse transcriptase domain-containing protein n=1 Tax=Ananas comosus var. bracteatus TaxID=296719 RepID=A0A6V7PEZ7_ANACO|nr:unnamed protein product [Ananas comosus var. bracteatus]
MLDIREFCPSCPVRVEDWIMPVDLLALRKLGEFDVVLGMDWLTKYYATIDCKNRTVTFREPGQTEVVFRGCRSSLFAMTISSSRARQLISRGCIAYLASFVLKGDDDTPRIEDIRWCGNFRTCFRLSYRVSIRQMSGCPEHRNPLRSAREQAEVLQGKRPGSDEGENSDLRLANSETGEHCDHHCPRVTMLTSGGIVVAGSLV